MPPGFQGQGELGSTLEHWGFDHPICFPPLPGNLLQPVYSLGRVEPLGSFHPDSRWHVLSDDEPAVQVDGMGCSLLDKYLLLPVRFHASFPVFDALRLY